MRPHGFRSELRALHRGVGRAWAVVPRLQNFRGALVADSVEFLVEIICRPVAPWYRAQAQSAVVVPNVPGERDAARAVELKLETRLVHADAADGAHAFRSPSPRGFLMFASAQLRMRCHLCSGVSPYRSSFSFMVSAARHFAIPNSSPIRLGSV